MKRTLLYFSMLLLGFPAAAATRRRAVEVPSPFPACSMITGTPAVTFTRDHGATLAPTAERLSGIGYTYGLAALDAAGTLLAWHKNDLLISTDNGCSWRVAASFEDPEFPPRIAPAKGGRAYAWSDNRSFLVRYDGRGAIKLKQPIPFVGVGVDPVDGSHVRAGGSDGTIWETRDAGETWTRIAILTPAASPVIIYRFAFDPANLDHVLAGTTIDGTYASFDAGRTWQHSMSLFGHTNVFEVAVSPADPNTVWAEGIDLGEELRHLYLSRDGGASFRAVIDQTDSVHLINGNIMAAHPLLPDVLYFVFGTYFQNYGTDLYRFDAGSGSLTVTHSDYNDINAIAFSPLRPNLMYLGLEVESGVR
ncbi:MAG TPA: dispase autolysis-inducing protein [Thermoanaerobaculia bacterium]|nr:dispase autolysis-inducing protein [Thermoanaerobaculia bacterium]